ncbi:trypsin-like peptidase domain-containing protein [Paraburkholderia sediminicola]|uniref:trypsin-like peptidase domain-containing protein n=1 Tax=Paraburkholderia sediminicola TaxID=458836 RepID=UPI0038B9EDF7
MANISFVSEENAFVPEYMPILIRIDRSKGLDDEERIRWLGSAFVVGVQMLFTAKHVALQLLAEDPDLAHGRPSRIQYAVIQALKGTQQLIVWNIHSIGMIDNCDVALVTLSPAHNRAKNYLRWSGLTLSFVPPRIGDRVAESGVHKIDIKSLRMDGDNIHVELDAKRTFSEGVVKDVHFESRDRGMYSFPCFQLDAQFDAGMSGGYVINERNEVCGVVCGSLAATSEDEEHVSYAALLWPVVSLPVPPEWIPGAVTGVDYLLWDYYKQATVKPIGLERVSFSNELATRGVITSSYTDPTEQYK